MKTEVIAKLKEFQRAYNAVTNIQLENCNVEIPDECGSEIYFFHWSMYIYTYKIYKVESLTEAIQKEDRRCLYRLAKARCITKQCFEAS